MTEPTSSSPVEATVVAGMPKPAPAIPIIAATIAPSVPPSIPPPAPQVMDTRPITVIVQNTNNNSNSSEPASPRTCCGHCEAGWTSCKLGAEACCCAQIAGCAFGCQWCWRACKYQGRCCEDSVDGCGECCCKWMLMFILCRTE